MSAPPPKYFTDPECKVDAKLHERDPVYNMDMGKVYFQKTKDDGVCENTTIKMPRWHTPFTGKASLHISDGKGKDTIFRNVRNTGQVMGCTLHNPKIIVSGGEVDCDSEGEGCKTQ